MSGLVERMLVMPTTVPSFIRNKIAIFFVRDPRDILVSSYYSFGFTHGLSKVDEIREKEEETRRFINDITLDKYVLDSVENQVKNFKVMYDLYDACERSTILRYEDMIDDFEVFSEQLLTYLPIKDDVVRAIYEKSRPRKSEDLTSHRRSGQVQGFRHKLKDETIEVLNSKLADTLELFGYGA